MIRRIHLDFHTHPQTEGIGAAFDPEAFAERLRRAGVTMLTTPGKCHFGNLYHDSEVGHTHPHLARPDLFPATVAACTARGIRVQAYFTLGLDDAAAEAHPEWRQRFADGRHASWGYRHLCYASPYVEAVVVPEVIETLARCPGVCGFWFDISLHVDGAFYSASFEAAARERLGDRADDVDARWHLARRLVGERCRLLDETIRARLPEAENFFNSLVSPGEEREHLPLVAVPEVEHPLLFKGPEHLTVQARRLRWRGKPTVGLVSRFQGPWADPGSLRTPDQMRFDVGRVLALGCHVSMGDHRHPDGTLEPRVYEQLGPLYGEADACARWLDAAAPCREAVLLSGVEEGSGTGANTPTLPAATQQAARLLEEIGVQFDIATDRDEPPAAPLWIWSPTASWRPEGTARVRRHVEEGGALLAMDEALPRLGEAAELLGCRPAAWRGGAPEAAGEQEAAGIGHEAGPAAGAEDCGPAGDFLRCAEELGLPAFAQILKRPTRLVEARPGAEVLGQRYRSCSVKPLYAGREPRGPVLLQTGRVLYSAADLVAEQAATGAPYFLALLAALCDRLLGGRLVRHDAGASVAAHLHRVGPGYALHLVHWALDRWTGKPNSIPTLPTLGPVEVRLRLPAPVARVLLPPAEEELAFEEFGGVCRFTVPSVHAWRLVGVELAG